MNFAFRVDSSSVIGSGHLVRCLTLAESLKGKGSHCFFICRDFSKHFLNLITETGFELRLLSGHFSQCNQESASENVSWLGVDWETDSTETKEAIGGDLIDWLIVDHYGIDHRWESALRSCCQRLLVIDDLADRRHDCDLLLDQNLVEAYTTRYEKLVPKNCFVLAGPQFSLLQPQYADLHRRIPTRSGPIRRILVYFGGADSHNLTGKTVDAFLEIGRSDIQLDVVITPANSWNTNIVSKASGFSNIKFYESLPSLSHLIANADLCIGASGATSWERCCLGLPAVVVTLAANQIPIAKELSRCGAIDWVGHYDSISVSDLANAIGRCLENPDLNAYRSSISYGLLDGDGVSKVVNYLMINSESELSIRRANLDDESLILSWANDPSVRISSFNSSSIAADTHRAWFHNRLRNIDGCYFFVVCTVEGLPIGQVRFERSGSEWEIHYSLSPCGRGRGLGRKTLAIALDEFRKMHPNAKILGRVKPDNVPSCRVFQSLGFRCDLTPEGNLIYRSV